MAPLTVCSRHPHLCCFSREAQKSDGDDDRVWSSQRLRSTSGELDVARARCCLSEIERVARAEFSPPKVLARSPLAKSSSAANHVCCNSIAALRRGFDDDDGEERAGQHDNRDLPRRASPPRERSRVGRPRGATSESRRSTRLERLEMADVVVFVFVFVARLGRTLALRQSAARHVRSCCRDTARDPRSGPTRRGAAAADQQVSSARREADACGRRDEQGSICTDESAEARAT